uniref:Beta-defensin-like domain-containing protein n=1 Tax=Podarcis muralis TaxID=64176 RepID=A0A670HNJ3_PODMU
MQIYGIRSAQNQEPQNARQCYNANGICFPIRCPNNYKRIGRCFILISPRKPCQTFRFQRTFTNRNTHFLV